jgi:hypothetical protein
VVNIHEMHLDQPCMKFHSLCRAKQWHVTLKNSTPVAFSSVWWMHSELLIKRKTFHVTCQRLRWVMECWAFNFTLTLGTTRIQSCQLYASAAFYSQGNSFVLISVRGWVDARSNKC